MLSPTNRSTKTSLIRPLLLSFRTTTYQYSNTVRYSKPPSINENRMSYTLYERNEQKRRSEISLKTESMQRVTHSAKPETHEKSH